MPVSIDQNANNKMAARAQNLYRPLPNRTESEVSFFTLGAVVVGSESSSFISIYFYSALGFSFSFYYYYFYIEIACFGVFSVGEMEVDSGRKTVFFLIDRCDGEGLCYRKGRGKYLLGLNTKVSPPTMMMASHWYSNSELQQINHSTSRRALQFRKLR